MNTQEEWWFCNWMVLLVDYSNTVSNVKDMVSDTSQNVGDKLLSFCLVVLQNSYFLPMDCLVLECKELELSYVIVSKTK
jgi:hypothetical protein